MRTLSAGASGEPAALVSQLIMGAGTTAVLTPLVDQGGHCWCERVQAGKTTVVLPLLALYLADGSQLLMQVCCPLGLAHSCLTLAHSCLHSSSSHFIVIPTPTAVVTCSF